MTNSLHLDQARLPDGWSRDVRLSVEDGVIKGLAIGAESAGERLKGGDEPGAIAKVEAAEVKVLSVRISAVHRCAPGTPALSAKRVTR